MYMCKLAQDRLSYSCIHTKIHKYKHTHAYIYRCKAYARLLVASTSGMRAGQALILGPADAQREKVTVLDVRSALEVWVLRAPNMMSHATGVLVSVMQLGASTGVQITTLSSALGAGATSVAVTDRVGISAGDLVTVGVELVRVTAVSNNMLTVVRGVGGTADVAHASGDGVHYRVGYASAVQKDAAALRIYAPEFVIRDMGQSTAYPGAANTLTVTLVSNVALTNAASSTVTISGLTGTQTANAALSIADVGASGSTTVFGATAAWTQAPGTLVLTVAAGQTMAAGIVYKFSFGVVNPSSAQAPPSPITIEAGGSVAITLSPVTADIWSIPNVLGSNVGDATPLKVYSPAFVVKDMSQSSNSAGASNTITVTVATNADLAAGSVITVSGLTGVQTASDAGLPVADVRVTLETGVVSSVTSATQIVLQSSASKTASIYVVSVCVCVCVCVDICMCCVSCKDAGPVA